MRERIDLNGPVQWGVLKTLSLRSYWDLEPSVWSNSVLVWRQWACPARHPGTLGVTSFRLGLDSSRADCRCCTQGPPGPAPKGNPGQSYQLTRGPAVGQNQIRCGFDSNMLINGRQTRTVSKVLAREQGLGLAAAAGQLGLALAAAGREA